MAKTHPIPSDPRFQDLSGRTFGKLTVLFYAGKDRTNKYSLWHCRCECGRERTLVSSQLTLSGANSCVWCAKHRTRDKTNPTAEDLTGRVFGRLTVLSLERRIKGRKRSSHWLCRCECGETKVVRGDSLKAGMTASCGCLKVVQTWRGDPKPDTRTCTKCGETKPLTVQFFHANPLCKWGLNTKCVGCARADQNRHNRAAAGKARAKCLVAYSGDPPRCQCPGCGETHVEFLTIDHVDGNGAEHRRSLNRSNTYAWLVRNNFPPGFRVLCWNCNCSRGRYRYCPHER